MKTYQRFGRGGCFKCLSCQKLTRDVDGENGKVELCKSCYKEAIELNREADDE